MKAFILSAGQGTRLRPLTDDRPKGMVTLKGKTLIERQVEAMRLCGLSDIAVIAGHMRENVSVPTGVQIFEHKRYAETNMVGTLLSVKEQLQSCSEVVVSYGDIVYHEDNLRRVLSSKADVAVAVDLDWEAYFRQRFDDPLDDAESLVMEDGYIVDIGQARPAMERVQAQYIGLMKFSGQGMQAFIRLYEEGKRNERPIGWGRMADEAYMTDMLQELIKREHRIAAVPVRGRWAEIDSLTDLELAQNMDWIGE